MWFSKTFKSMDATFASLGEEMDEAMADVEKQTSGGVTITNNNGHVVIVGKIKSLRVNEQIVEVNK